MSQNMSFMKLENCPGSVSTIQHVCAVSSDSSLVYDYL
jgi:hypothetical protein